LEDDVVALMKKRVVDLAGTLGKGVKVGIKRSTSACQDIHRLCRFILEIS